MTNGTNGKDEFVELGDEVTDAVTGFVGIATAATTFLNGCRRIQITPKADATGKYQDERWLDEPQLTVTKRSAYLQPVRKEKRDDPTAFPPGGDRPDCPSR